MGRPIYERQLASLRMRECIQSTLKRGEHEEKERWRVLIEDDG